MGNDIYDMIWFIEANNANKDNYGNHQNLTAHNKKMKQKVIIP